MASIKGIELKGVTRFKGHEGEPLIQGNIYYMGRKVGYYSQDAHGGEDMVDAPRDIKDLFKDYVVPGNEQFAKDYPLVFSGLSWVLLEVAQLNELEAKLKKAQRAGYKTLIVVDINEYEQFLVEANLTDKSTRSSIIGYLSAKYDKLKGAPDKAYHIYNSAADFVIA